MGWNEGYKLFEYTVVGAYNLGKLDKELLTVLMEPYRDTDIDSGGSEGLMSKDGKDVEQIVIEAWGLEMPQKPPGEYSTAPDVWDAYHELVGERFRSVTEHFNWR